MALEKKLSDFNNALQRLEEAVIKTKEYAFSFSDVML
jgi:hypothetical protein